MPPLKEATLTRSGYDFIRNRAAVPSARFYEYMQSDEQTIRNLITRWVQATAEGDAMTISKLMADDVVFLLPDQPPMRGRDAFMVGFAAALAKVRIAARSDVQEIQISGEFAYCWNHLLVTMTPREGGAPIRRSGFTLTILRKEAEGHWVVYRDANLLTSAP